MTKKALEIEKRIKNQINLVEREITNQMTEDEKKIFLDLLKKASYNLYQLDLNKKMSTKMERLGVSPTFQKKGEKKC